MVKGRGKRRDQFGLGTEEHSYTLLTFIAVADGLYARSTPLTRRYAAVRRNPSQGRAKRREGS